MGANSRRANPYFKDERILGLMCQVTSAPPVTGSISDNKFTMGGFISNYYLGNKEKFKPYYPVGPFTFELNFCLDPKP